MFVTFFVGVASFFASPFCIMYLILYGIPESSVDTLYWGTVILIWFILEIIAFIEWRVNKDEKL